MLEILDLGFKILDTCQFLAEEFNQERNHAIDAFVQAVDRGHFEQLRCYGIAVTEKLMSEIARKEELVIGAIERANVLLEIIEIYTADLKVEKRRENI